jgi:hypothetical protein
MMKKNKRLPEKKVLKQLGAKRVTENGIRVWKAGNLSAPTAAALYELVLEQVKKISKELRSVDVSGENDNA